MDKTIVIVLLFLPLFFINAFSSEDKALNKNRTIFVSLDKGKSWSNFYCLSDFLNSIVIEMKMNGNITLSYSNGQAIKRYSDFKELFSNLLIEIRNKCVNGLQKESDESFEAISKLDFQIFPNPISNEIKIYTNSADKTNIQIIISNLIGEAFYKDYHQLNVGENIISIKSESFSEGVYILSIKSSDFAVSKLIIVNK